MESSRASVDSPRQEILSGEIILYDVLRDIFGYLNIYDLSRAARVCKSWYYSAKIEKSKRGPQVMILQALEDSVASGFSNINPVVEKELIDDFKFNLRVKPCVGIFFTDGKYPAPADCDSVAYEICVAHQWTQPDDCVYVAIEALRINVDEKIIGGEKNITGSIFLPAFSRVNYIITETSSHCIGQYFEKSNSLITDITDKLFSVQSAKTCFLIFIYKWKDEPTLEYRHNQFMNKILSNLKSRYDPGSYSLWGGAINDVFTMAPDTRPLHHSTSFCAISISGSLVESWSIVLDYKLSTSAIEEKLFKFKKSVILKTDSIAFLILPSIKEDTDEINASSMNIFRNIFPKITLISVFNDNNNFCLSVDSTCNALNPELKHFNSYAYMILTYKL